MTGMPASSIVFFRFGSSCAAQRGCWKLFHDTPTVQPAPADPPAAALAPALAPAPPPLVHAAATTTSAANSDAILRFIWVLLQVRSHFDVKCTQTSG